MDTHLFSFFLLRPLLFFSSFFSILQRFSSIIFRSSPLSFQPISKWSSSSLPSPTLKLYFVLRDPGQNPRSFFGTTTAPCITTNHYYPQAATWVAGEAAAVSAAAALCPLGVPPAAVTVSPLWSRSDNSSGPRPRRRHARRRRRRRRLLPPRSLPTPWGPLRDSPPFASPRL